MQKFTKVLLFIVTLLISNSCKQYYEVPIPVVTSTGMTVKNAPVLRENVYILTEEAHNQIVSYSNGKLVLSGLEGIRSGRVLANGKIENLSSLKKGDILVTSPNAKASNGFLLEIVDVVRDGSDFIIDFIDASLEDVFKNADFVWEEEYPFDVPLDENFEVSLSFPPKNDKEKPKPNVKSNIKLKGKLAWLLKTKFDVQIKDYELQRAAYSFSKSNDHYVKSEVALGLSVGDNISIPYLGYAKRFRLKEVKFLKTAIIPVGAIPFPVVLAFSIGIDVEISADGKLSFSAEIIKDKSTITYEGVYEKGTDWRLNKSEVGGSEPVAVTSKSVSGEIKVGAYLSAAIRFYDSDVAGIFGKVGAYGKLEANCGNNFTRTTKVTSAFDGELAFTLDIFSDKYDISLKAPFNSPPKTLHIEELKNGCSFEDTAKVVPPIDNEIEKQVIAISTSDPHIKTLDGYRFSFMAVGEFTALKSTTDNFQVQVRQEEIKSFNSEGVTSFNTGIAINTGSDVLCIYPDNRLFVNRTALPLNFQDYQLKNNWVIQNRNSELSVRNNIGDEIQVKFFNGSNLDYYVSLANNRKGRVRGLLGNYDGNVTNDLFRGDNNQKILDDSHTNLYPVYSDSWRIKQAESLFVYDTGKNTESYTDRSFPRKPIIISNADRVAAERICRNEGVTDPFALENCIVDVHLTGRYELAERAIDFEQAGNSLNSFSIGRFQSTDVQLDYFGTTVANNAAVLNTISEGFSRVNMKQGVNIRNGFTTEFSFNTEDFNPESCFFLAMWPTNPLNRSDFDKRIGICFGFENSTPITFISYDGFLGGGAGKAPIPNFTDRKVHKVRITETRLTSGKFRLQVYFDDMVNAKITIDNNESIEGLIEAKRKTGFIEFQINRGSPSIVRVFNWTFSSL